MDALFKYTCILGEAYGIYPITNMNEELWCLHCLKYVDEHSIDEKRVKVTSLLFAFCMNS